MQRMADVRFLRHLRDNNPNKTTLLRGKKLSAEDALQARLAEAKEGNSVLLSKLNSLVDFGKRTRTRANKSEGVFQWVAEAKRLEQLVQAEWKAMQQTITEVAAGTEAADEAAELADELDAEARECVAQWEHEALAMQASIHQLQNLRRVHASSAHAPSASLSSARAAGTRRARAGCGAQGGAGALRNGGDAGQSRRRGGEMVPAVAVDGQDGGGGTQGPAETIAETIYICIYMYIS